MTGIQRVAIAVVMVAAGSMVGCTNDTASPEPSPPPSATSDPTIETKPPSSTATTTSTSTSTTTPPTASESGGTSSQQTVVRTDGGSIEVRGNGEMLEVVDISTAEGWEVQVERPDDRRLVAVFTGSGGQSEVTIVLTDDGIQTSTRSQG